MMLSTLARTRVVALIPIKNSSSGSRILSKAATTGTKKCTAARSPLLAKRFLSNEVKKDAAPTAEKTAVEQAAASTKSKQQQQQQQTKEGWWHSAKFWGDLGAYAGWGMSAAAIYDATLSGPEMISLNMTGVLIVYSSLFARWAYVVKPQNLLLCACHVTNVGAQINQMRRAMEYKLANGQDEQVKELTIKAAQVGAVCGVAIAGGPTARKAIAGSTSLGVLSTWAASEAGPFTVHFWAPMSKWLISGASFLDLHRPTDKISLPQYTALTLTGFFFSRYALLVSPINYLLCSVNIALFGSSFWHLGRKVNADYIAK